eukprot:gene3720-4660_t
MSTDSLYFIHIPKTGGSSVEWFAQKHLGVLYGEKLAANHNWKERKTGLPWTKLSERFADSKSCSWWHVPPRYFKDEIDWKGEGAFTIIREPVQRAWSQARWHAAELNMKNCSAVCLKELLLKSVASVESAHEYESAGTKTKAYFGEDCHWVPQYLYFTDSDNRILPNTTLLCFENFSEEVLRFFRSKYPTKMNGFGKNHRLRAINAGWNLPLSPDLSIQQRIRKLYKKDAEWHDVVCRRR